MGKTSQWTPKMYESIRASHTGCAETPIRTKTINPLSRIERGRNAERNPIVKPRMSHIRTPPSRSEAVTGSAVRISSRTWTG